MRPANDLDFTIENIRFNVRAAALILDNGRLLMVKDKDNNYRYTVGGRVSIRETTEEAVIREAFEETGIHYEIDRLVAVEEWLPEDMQNHQICFYYLMKHSGKTAALDGCKTDQTNESLHLIPIKDFGKYTIAPPILKDLGLDNPDKITDVKHFISKSSA
jgi:ADP-ribose pyrophosphatase YjhB (NUDIX family)